MFFKKLFKVFIVGTGIILLPIMIDWFIFGNSFPSNIDNQTWASFLGGYLGGVATLVAVFITIKDSNKKIELQKKETEERENEYKRELEKKEAEQKKYSIKPYLDTRFNFFDEKAIVNMNDRVFDMVEEKVERVRYSLTSTDRKFIEIGRSSGSYVFLKYIIRNIGAGSAVDMKIIVNDFQEDIAISRDEIVGIYLLIKIEDSHEIKLDIKLEYWDVEKRGHYYQNDSMIICIEKTEQIVKPVKHTNAMEI